MNSTRNDDQDIQMDSNTTVIAEGIPEVPTTEQPPDGCRALDIPDCSEVPYTYTTMPNLVGHTSFEHALEDFKYQYAGVLQVQCSPMTQQFVCGVYFPACTETHSEYHSCQGISP